MSTIGINKLKKYQIEKGLSQQGLSQLVGISQGAISHYYTGRRKTIDPHIAAKIADVTKIGFEEFYKYEKRG